MARPTPQRRCLTSTMHCSNRSLLPRLAAGCAAGTRPSMAAPACMSCWITSPARSEGMRLIRSLDLAQSIEPGRPAWLSAASGLVRTGDEFCVVADDELHLGRFRLDVGH